jgi:hypothetical protein
MTLGEMPAAGADDEDGGLRTEGVGLAFRAGVADAAADGVAQIDLAGEVVIPRGRVGVFEIGHEDAGARVEGVDDHLAFHRAGDFDAAVGEVGGDGSHFPGGAADFCSLF